MKVTEEMVTRFLGWELPQTFAPDAGISFTPPQIPEWWPVGTNLLTAVEVRAMLEHVLGGCDESKSDCVWTDEDEGGPWRAGCNGETWYASEDSDAPPDWMKFCPWCGNNARFATESHKPNSVCERCGGTGLVTIHNYDGNGSDADDQRCPECTSEECSKP